VRSIFSRENIVKYWRYCQMYGVRNATRLAVRRLRKPMGGPPVVTPLSRTLIAQPEDLLSALGKTVSIVIPTKNAAAYVTHLVEKLKAQRGILPCEIIFVDSGSTDSTVALAEREGVKVLEINPSEFTHSFSRNKGAGAATTDYLLFMVQDALPLTNFWLWEMVTVLEQEKLAAVSCAEYPRADCDLFYRFMIHNHYDSPRPGEDRILAWNESCSSYLGLRSSAQLSDVAALIRRDVFENYRYKTAYAEDLDLGIRLIRDGHRLGFLHSTRVLHSHNRSSYYFLKRGYVDARFLPEVFPNFTYPVVENKSKLFGDILTMGNRIRGVARDIQNIGFPLPTRELTQRIMAVLATPQTEPHLSAAGLDSELGTFMQELFERHGTVPSEGSKEANMIWPHVLDHCERLHEWIYGIYDVADRNLVEDIFRAMEKVFAIHSGTHMAYLYLTQKGHSQLDETLVALDRIMTAGV
jgi:glycosyltransferase involved in cell wall biosynthesis